MCEKAELIEIAIEQYMAGLDFEDMEYMLRNYLLEEWQSAPCEAQEKLIESTGARELAEAKEDANLSLRDEDWD